MPLRAALHYHGITEDAPALLIAPSATFEEGGNDERNWKRFQPTIIEPEGGRSFLFEIPTDRFDGGTFVLLIESKREERLQLPELVLVLPREEYEGLITEAASEEFLPSPGLEGGEAVASFVAALIEEQLRLDGFFLDGPSHVSFLASIDEGARERVFPSDPIRWVTEVHVDEFREAALAGVAEARWEMSLTGERYGLKCNVVPVEPLSNYAALAAQDLLNGRRLWSGHSPALSKISAYSHRSVDAGSPRLHLEVAYDLAGLPVKAGAVVEPQRISSERQVPVEVRMERTFVEEEQVSEPPFEGEGSESTQEERTQAESAQTQWVPGYEEMGASRLRNIAVASFGPLTAASDPVAVTSRTDDRIQITETSTYPWRANASLLITAADSSQYIGTGWFIGPHTLATAGHCVFIHAPGTPRHGWVRSIQVMPGRNGTTLPYGSITSTDFRSIDEWTENGDQNYDYGAIIIPTELGNTVGWFGFGVWPDDELRTSTVYIAGYPSDKPGGTQWLQLQRFASVKARKVYYARDARGQSGNGVYRKIKDGWYAIAIQASGGATANSGIRIVRSVYDNLVAWKA